MTCIIPTVLCAARGTDVTITLTISDEIGPVDLTGITPVLFDVDYPLSGRITANITDADGGILVIAIEGTSPILLGKHGFRLQLGNSIALPFVLEVE